MTQQEITAKEITAKEIGENLHGALHQLRQAKRLINERERDIGLNRIKRS